MSRVEGKIRGTFLDALAHLPFGVLYALSDVVTFLLRHVIRYRRRTIMRNLDASFPGMTAGERKKILNAFYRNFSDYIFETLKLGHISDEEMERRMTFTGMETVDRLLGEGKNIVAYFAHAGNWEWVPSITLHTPEGKNPGVVFSQVYRPLKSKWFDERMLSLRSRFGSVSYPKASVLRDLLMLRRDKKLFVTGFMSDQKPSHGDTIHVVEFLNQPTAIITGTAKLANRLGTAVVYFDMTKPSRGHYNVDIVHITDDASQMSVAELTDRYAALLQTTILRQPPIWLWSHNRWKIPVTFEQEELAK